MNPLRNTLIRKIDKLKHSRIASSRSFGDWEKKKEVWQRITALENDLKKMVD